MGSSEGQTYCLRWNNHKSNLVEILDALIKMECYVDCTIVVDEQVQFKAHRVVLAANSPYFQSILQDVPMDHCSILFPGVKEFEMRALLEYMYTGEVNVTKSQIPRIMKIAEQLEVKGLFEMHDLKGNFGKMDEQASSPAPTAPHHPAFPANNETAAIKTNNNQASPITSSNNITSAAQSSSASPPYSSYKPYSNLYPRSRSPVHTPTAAWPLPHLDSSISSHLSRVYESVADMNPLKRKKLSSISSMLNASAGNPAIDTPILRNVLAQSNAADSSQAMPLSMSDRERSERSSNGSNGTDYSDKKYHDRPIDEPHSPYTDKSYDEDSAMDQSQGYGSDRIASYVPQQNQKPEWKRYKQYTRNDILSAIECVKNGMSALQASRKFGVPSRTLYDKVKKMGITTGRPMNRSSMKRSPNSGGNSLSFPYGLTGASHSYPDIQVPSQSHSHHDDDRSMDRERHSMNPHPAAALLPPSFLQQALDIRGGDVSLHAMALAAAAHARANGVSTSPGTPGTARSPSPSMNALAMRAFMRPPSTEMPIPQEHRSRKQSPSAIVATSEHINSEEDDKVEDLSMGRSKVIVPPLSKVIQQLKERRFEEEYAKERECEPTPEIIKQETHQSTE
ncbi:protein tramtrack, beta isoform-like [Culicoides brevitarsis]|uniref:protein tramtrack, beta isoform-like n=1 Tax=Culicoides brevitarsis TaxID=469753 RepID=UPI00307B7BA0